MKQVIIVFLLLLSTPAAAFQCEPTSKAELYTRAERVLLVEVTNSKLEDGRDFGIDESGLEYTRVISHESRVIEVYKGRKESTLQLIELAGIGTGFIGMFPGFTYLVMVEPLEDDVPQKLRGYVWVNICNTFLGYIKKDTQSVAEVLNEMQQLRDHQ